MSADEKNVYTCQACAGVVVTIDRDDGVTPFSIRCRAAEKCDGLMYSTFYQVGKKPLVPQYEWFRPDDEELQAEINEAVQGLRRLCAEDDDQVVDDMAQGLESSMREHREIGGLSLRVIPKGGR